MISANDEELLPRASIARSDASWDSLPTLSIKDPDNQEDLAPAQSDEVFPLTQEKRALPGDLGDTRTSAVVAGAFQTTVFLPRGQSVNLGVDQSWTVGHVLHEVMEICRENRIQGVDVEAGSEYVLKVFAKLEGFDGERCLWDDSVTLYDDPCIRHCREASVKPRFSLLNREQELRKSKLARSQALQGQISYLMGRSIVETDEVRKLQQTIKKSMRELADSRKGESRLKFLLRYLPLSPVAILSDEHDHFNVSVCYPGTQMAKGVSCTCRTTPAALIEMVAQKIVMLTSRSFDRPVEDLFLLKPTGRFEFLYANVPLVRYDFIQRNLKLGGKISLNLVEIDALEVPLHLWKNG